MKNLIVTEITMISKFPQESNNWAIQMAIMVESRAGAVK